MVSLKISPRLASVAVLIALAFASPTPAPSIAYERRSVASHGWSPQRRADPDVIIPLRISLTQPNIHNLDAYLLEIADPNSPKYGKHWSHEDVAETFRPSKEAVDTVHSWLVDHGIDNTRIRLGQDGGALHLDVTVAEAEDILATEYHVFRHADGTERVGVHESYRLPGHVAEHVDLVWPTLHFGTGPQRHAIVGPNSDVEVCLTTCSKVSHN